jgi:hypothetical protein
MKKHVLVAQIALGASLAFGIAYAWLSSRLPLLETTYPDGSQPITWRSGIAAAAIVLIGQVASYLIIRKFARNRNLDTN